MRGQMMRKSADTDITRAVLLSGLSAAGGWAFNKYVLGNKSLKSQILSTAIGGLLGGGGSVAYDMLTDNKGYYAKKREELKERGSNEGANFMQNSLGTFGLTSGVGALGVSSARSAALLTDRLTYGDSLSNIDIEPSSVPGKAAKRYILGLPDKLSQKSWDAAKDVDRVNSASEALFGRAHVKLSPAQQDSVDSLVSGSGVQRIDNDIANTQITIGKLRQDVDNLELAAQTAGSGTNTRFYNDSYNRAVTKLEEAESKLAEQESLRAAVERYRSARNNVHTNRELLAKVLFNKGNRYGSRKEAWKKFFSLDNLKGTTRRYIKGGALKSGVKIGTWLSPLPILIDGADNLFSWYSNR